MKIPKYVDTLLKHRNIKQRPEVIHCKNCKYLMISDFYGECSKGYMGIVQPNDYCSRGERKASKRNNIKS